MADDPRNRTPTEEPPYRVYRSGGRDRPPASDERDRPDAERIREELRGGGGVRGGGGHGGEGGGGGRGPAYKTYRASPRGLLSRLRGVEEIEPPWRPRRSAGRDAAVGAPALPWWRRQLRPLRLLLWVVGLIVAWLLLSLVLFVISASNQSGAIPRSVQAALTPGSNMLTGTDTVLVIGTDQRPKGSKEPGAFSGGIRSDTMMLWRIGGGTSRRLSIPRDTIVPIPGYGTTKINAAYSYGGPALAIRTVESLTGVKINHLIVVNLANFPKFINAIGGIDVRTGRICSVISGGVQNGGFSLFLRPGVHHLDGRDALTLARTRENRCNASSNDLTREAYQQKILNAIKSKLVSPSTFFHLPWASWAAPQAVRTDMGGFTLLELFAAAEMGGSAPTDILSQNHLPLPDVQSPAGQEAIHRAVARLMNGS